MDRVSMLLGHSSIKLTEKHYSPWAGWRRQLLFTVSAGGAYVATPSVAMYAPVPGSATCGGATVRAHRTQVVAWAPSGHPKRR